jgi:hypothetical protein
VLGKFTRKHETNSGLNLAAGKRGQLVVSGKLSGFRGDTLKYIVNEGGPERQAQLGETGIRVDHRQNRLDVVCAALGTFLLFVALPLLLLAGGGGHATIVYGVNKGDTTQELVQLLVPLDRKSNVPGEDIYCYDLH